MKMKKLGACAVMMMALSGCGAGEGEVTFATWGEGYIEEGIPAADFADGWSVRYTKFLVGLGAVRVADESGAVAAEMKGSKLFNHVSPGVKEVVKFTGVEAKAWTKVSYQLTGGKEGMELGEGATEADLALMKQGGYTVYAEGEAEKGSVKKTFRWGFARPTAYTECKGEEDGKETFGVVVTNGGADEIELTIHGDHLFYDDLQAENAVLRFASIAAADANDDGEVTLEELGMVKLTSIDPAEGAYGTGAAGDVNDLGAFVVALSRTVGHYRGEGECFAGDP